MAKPEFGSDNKASGKQFPRLNTVFVFHSFKELGMKVKHAALVSLLQELDMPTADKWPENRLQKKLKSLPEFIESEEAEAKTADGKKLLKTVLAAIEEEEYITITGIPVELAGAGSKEEADPAKAAKEEKTAKKAKAVEEEEEDEAPAKPAKKTAKPAETEEEDDDAPAKPKGKAPPKSAGGEGKPGIIATIVSTVKNATEEKPVSKKGILAVLTKAFPDRDADSMMRTINVQVPNRIKKDKKLNVVKNDKGYYVDGTTEDDEKPVKTAKPTKKPAADEDDD